MRILRSVKGSSRNISINDAIGVGVLGGVLGVVLGSSGESTLLGWLLSAGAGLVVGVHWGPWLEASFEHLEEPCLDWPEECCWALPPESSIGSSLPLWPAR